MSAAATEGALERVSVVGFKGCQAGVEQLPLRNDDHIEARSQLIVTENLSNQSFSSVALDSASELLRRRDAKPPARSAARQHEHGGIPAVHADAALVNLLELRAGLDPFIGPEIRQRLARADGEALAALGAPTLEHQPAVFRTHSNEKTVRLSATPRVRLKCPFPLHDPSL